MASPPRCNGVRLPGKVLILLRQARLIGREEIRKALVEAFSHGLHAAVEGPGSWASYDSIHRLSSLLLPH